MKNPLSSFHFTTFILFSVLFGSCSLFSESLPEGKKGENADELARKMLAAIGNEAWDSTRYVRWSFIGHDFLWDKKRKLVQVEWDDKKVLLREEDQSGLAYKDGKLLEGKAKKEALQKAWAHFCNDSFWLNAPAKVFDPGTVRKLVTTDSGDKRLLVTYTSGGVTPGDSYLWILNDNGRPKAYKMWVSKIPVGGMEASWEDWDTLSTGALIARKHQLSVADLRIEDLQAGQRQKELGLEEDPFGELEGVE